ncbi:unnamed protein product [Discula destructiva]
MSAPAGTKAFHLQKRDWLRATRDGSGDKAKDILATVIVKSMPRQTYMIKFLQEAFANPISVPQHMRGQSYLTKLLEEQYVQAGDAKVEGAGPSLGADEDQPNEPRSDVSSFDEEVFGDDSSDGRSITAEFKTPQKLRRNKRRRDEVNESSDGEKSQTSSVRNSNRLKGKGKVPQERNETSEKAI